ncbi:hypothetical protein CAC42_3346 [Sphaceloma murrayae]|uniref:Uncharacterized protein n=1 Tax=Sphaceloma murrayae TaxID=2082308 RepID=A0A2K1R136_9PEZI|nr:hypothetical protein CAC42_3346 [Sphaceloma murrayae]
MTSRQDFNVFTNGSEVASVFADRIKGRTGMSPSYFLVTGVSPKSLGGTVAINLAAHSPALLLLASRTPSNITSIINTIDSTTPCPTAAIPLDLSSLSSVRSAASQITSLTPSLDLIINTAAVVSTTRKLSEDGIELQLAVTHVGHFLLTSLLLPTLISTAESSRFPKGSTRIVNVSSLGHRFSPFRFSDYNFEKFNVPLEERPPESVPATLKGSEEEPYAVFVAYGQSKTANLLHVVELERRFRDRGVGSWGLHPGSIETDLSRELDQGQRAMIKATSKNWVTLDQGTATILVAALDPALDEKKGSIYLSDCQLSDAAGHSIDPGAAKRLWELSEKLSGLDGKL